ncbi:MAG TPA: damage-inducible protein CinA [Eubacterium sp.]|jgi:PncC family amidohydrolase|nr:damage-inducible protein CinA [Eubacterium sp.]HBZ52743.1 damage-inducible protein CinA [Eubacterium sp.]
MIMKDLVEYLKKKNITISTAESFTGGLVAASVVSIDGASAVFSNGYVVYSKEAKSKTLNIPMEVLDKYGTISSECATYMAKQAALISGSDIGVSTTGVAGPSTDEGQPVGTAYIGVHYKGVDVVNRATFVGSRNEIREAAVDYAACFVLSIVEELDLAESSIG